MPIYDFCLTNTNKQPILECHIQHFAVSSKLHIYTFKVIRQIVPTQVLPPLARDQICNKIAQVSKYDLRLSAVRQLVMLYRAVFDEKIENLYWVNGFSPVTVTDSVSLLQWHIRHYCSSLAMTQTILSVQFMVEKSSKTKWKMLKPPEMQHVLRTNTVIYGHVNRRDRVLSFRPKMKQTLKMEAYFWPETQTKLLSFSAKTKTKSMQDAVAVSVT